MPQQIAAEIEQIFLRGVHAGRGLILFGGVVDVSFTFLDVA